MRGSAVAKKQHVAFAHHWEWGMVACPTFAPHLARKCIPPGDVYHAQTIDSVGADDCGWRGRLQQLSVAFVRFGYAIECLLPAATALLPASCRFPLLRFLPTGRDDDDVEPGCHDG
jgi:hypothetical protein